jgi:hypothetical protein
MKEPTIYMNHEDVPLTEVLENNIVPSDTKIRMENGKEIKYVITDDSYEDEYGSLKSQYHAWRIEDNIPKLLTVEYYLNSHSDALRKITFGYNVKCKCCNHEKFVREEDYASLATFYSQEEVDKLTSEAYNQGYKDGNAFFYGMTSKDEERIKQMTKTL